MKRRTRTRTLILESLDPRLCLAASLGSVGMGEMHVEHAGAHVSHWHNSSRPPDVNQDQHVTPVDALVVINTLNARGARTLSDAEGEITARVDVNDDSQVTPADCLAVINELNDPSAAVVAVEESASDEVSADETTGEDGTLEDGTVDNETVDDGTEDDGTVDGGSEDDGTGDNGTTDDVPTGHHGHGDKAKPSLEDLFARADANEDGILTEDELPSPLWERLSGADTDSSGGITLEELTAFKPEGRPHGRPHDGHVGHGDRDPLRRFDENNDGLLTQDELPEEVWDRISAADTDGDGTISAEELAAYRPEPPSREDLFARLDADGDGALTEVELPPELWERLSPADTDGDGGITLDELVAFKPERDRHGPRTDGRCDGDLFDRLDQNDDGLLIQDEVPEGLWERILPADSDGDSQISSEELAAFRPAPPQGEDFGPAGAPGASSAQVMSERGARPHRGGGMGATTAFGGNARRG